MSVVRHPTNPDWWQVWYYPDGKKGGPKAKSFKGSYELALEYERKLREQSKRPAPAKVAFPTFAELVPQYLAHYRTTSLAPEVLVRYLGYWSEIVGTVQVVSIGEQHVDIYRAAREALGIKPTTINKELSALSKFLKWCKKKKYIDQLPEIERYPEKMTKAPLPEVPTEEEVKALINCMIWPRCGLFFCLYYGGLRADEGRNLRAEDVYLDRYVMIVRGKGNKQRVVPIVEELEPILNRRLAEVPTGLLWTTKRGAKITDLKGIIKHAKERAGLTRHIYPHLLRHAFGTHNSMRGVGLRALQTTMGHVSIKTTTLYTTLSDDAIIKELRDKNRRI